MNLESFQPQLDRIQKNSLSVGAALFAACVAGAFFTPAQFFQSYLMAFLLWLGFGLGCLVLLMLHHLVAGSWGFPIQRLLEAGSRTLPILALLFIPLFFGLEHLYSWSHPEQMAEDPILRQKEIYLNVPFFALRAVLYFALWVLLAYFVNKWSRRQDETGDAAITRRLQLISGPGILLCALTITFASIDWAMSIEPKWYSTIYGLKFLVGQALTALAFVIVVLVPLARYKPLADIIVARNFHDLGNLLLALVMLWAYLAFSQLLIIYSGNLPEEVIWYVQRFNHSWLYLAAFLLIFHFAVPFLLLLSRQNKRNVRPLRWIAMGVLVMRLVDLFWLIVPTFREEQVRVNWMDVAAPIALGGIWISAFFGQLKRRPLVPLHDPRLEESLSVAGSFH